MNNRTSLMVVFLAFLISFALPGVLSRPVDEDHLNSSTAAQIRDSLTKREIDNHFNSLLADRFLEELLNESPFPRSTRDLVQRNTASRRQWNGNMVRYG
ncbi:unnamed protein product [Hymenolepis diminuta]|uniref:Uncharacterized protein n=1 Tax=Hymenolepis diminuta TaxID=6216 RepID=A0A0R3SEI0_HYMDI|nr:unnamed protein product [Hymenolepis diminuta]VUZ39267.1 unnamed protein product [Hymenolepis diminuta]